jgi:cobalt-zinc-cadmium efflux system protein
MAWAASELAKKVPSPRRTYGWKRSTVLAALFNALLLLVGVGAIVWEAIQRFHDPPSVEGATVIWVAALGIVIGSSIYVIAGGPKAGTSFSSANEVFTP